MATSANPAPPPTQRGWQLSSTVRDCEATGREEGEAYARAESRAAILAGILRKQARQHFGCADPAGQEKLTALATGFAGDQLEDLGERLLTAESWSSWLANVEVPVAPPYPDYAKNVDINLDPDQPSIDTLMKVGMMGGGEGVVLLRLQKWHQPDLDKVLFDESLRLERLHKHRPIIAVILMWPASDDPRITGSYTGLDPSGKQTTVTYSLRRAWELLPEDALRSPGTMMLAPLCKGAKERMPEIITKIAQGLKGHKTDSRTIEAVWVTVYWAMGIVCTLEEAHAALGEHLAFIHSTPDYRTAKGHCFLDGYDAGTKAGTVAGARGLILRQGAARWGKDARAEAALAAIEDANRLEALALQVLTAAGWSALLGLPQANEPST